MEMMATCTLCSTPGPGTYYRVGYYEERITILHCRHGHKSVVLPQAPKFESLMESSARALQDGYTLECVGAGAAGRERLYEFASRVMLRHLNQSEEAVDALWRQAAKQSERQIGIFLTLQTVVFGMDYKISPKTAEFRNSVIHKGHIPTPTEAETFVRSAYAEAVELVEKLRKNCEPALHKCMLRDIKERSKQAPPGMPVSTTGAFYYFTTAALQSMSFEAALLSLRRGRALLASLPLAEFCPG